MSSELRTLEELVVKYLPLDLTGFSFPISFCIYILFLRRVGTKITEKIVGWMLLLAFATSVVFKQLIISIS